MTTLLMDEHDTAATMTTLEYLQAIYPADTPGGIVVVNDDQSIRRIGYGSGLPRLAGEIERLDQADENVWLQINTIDQRAVESRGRYARGTEREVRAVLSFHLDVDAEKAGHNYPPQGMILQALNGMPLLPSMVVLSGKDEGGVHVYWLMAEPFVINSEEDRLRAKSVSARWHRLLRAKLDPFELDSTFDLVRVLRAVGTTNHKYGTTVRCLKFNPDGRYRLEDFEENLPPEPPRTAPASPRVARDTSSIIERAERYVAKIPPAVSGNGGHNATFGVACKLVLGFDLAPEQAFPVLQGWNATCQPPWSDDELWHKLEGADRRPDERGYLLRNSSQIDNSTSRGNSQPRTPAESPADSHAFALTDSGNAERFVFQHRGKVRYCYLMKKWLAWDGKRWILDAEATVELLAKETARSIYSEAAAAVDNDERKAIVNWAKRSESASSRAAILRLARSEEGVPVAPDELDTNPWLFNVPNGTIDLRTGKIQAHCYTDLITKLCETPYNPDAQCPLWLAFQDRICAGNQSLIEFKQRFYGMCLTGVVRENILAIHHGPGANGKSVENETFIGTLGADYAMKAVSDLLVANRSNRHPTELADLFGKRFVACTETDDGRRLAEALVKELTGGDRIRARRMKEDFWEFSPTHKVVLATNHKPVVKGTDNGIWRRLQLVPFNVTIPKAEQDTKLTEKLRAERQGILAWAVRGCLEWQQHGLGEPDVIAAATGEYRQQQDILAGFLEECCILSKDARARAGDLLAAYRKWTGDERISQRRLGEALNEKGFATATVGGYVWRLGVGVKDETTA